MRRQPLFILVDNSSSTVGKPIQQVNDFIASLIKEAKSDPWFLETLHISLIEYGSKFPQFIFDLEEVDKVAPLTIASTTERRYLGKALELIIEKAKTKLIPRTIENKGDWLYTVLIFLFGASEDEYQIQINELKKTNPKPHKVILIGLNKDFLQKQNDITELMFCINEIEPREILKLMNLFIESDPTCSEKI
jgi:uncharacterized protein YegL